LSECGLDCKVASSRAGMMSASNLVIITFEQAWESFVAEVMDVIRSFSGVLGLGQQIIGTLILRNYTTLLDGREELYLLFV
jgi:hypothetical protein